MEHTKQQFIELFNTWQSEGLLDQYGVNLGECDGDTMLIVDSWETLTALHARINGYTGNCDLAVVFNFEDLNKEFDKTVDDLESTLKANPDHLGTISRLERKLKQLGNLVHYKRWVLDNEIEEVNFNDFDIETGFTDEYSNCGNCYSNIVRTSPDSYSWSAPLYLEDVGCVCSDCAKDFTEEVKESYKNECKSIPADFTPADLGLSKVNDESMENGMHEGMNDDPKLVIKALNESDIDCWFVVQPSQFYCSFDVYVEDKDFNRAWTILSGTSVEGVDISGNLKKALSNMPMSGSTPNGVVINTVNLQDGSVESRLVSNEEFIKGVKI